MYLRHVILRNISKRCMQRNQVMMKDVYQTTETLNYYKQSKSERIFDECLSSARNVTLRYLVIAQENCFSFSPLSPHDVVVSSRRPNEHVAVSDCVFVCVYSI